MKKQLQLILPVIFMILTSLTGYGQNVGDQFTVGNLEYKITSATKVEIADYTGTTTEVTIPPTVDNGPNTYTVTARCIPTPYKITSTLHWVMVKRYNR